MELQRISASLKAWRWATRSAAFFAMVACIGFLLGGCGHVSHSSAILTRNARVDLMDWHISGLWVINCPVAWVRVTNYNNVPIKDITFRYKTYTTDGRELNSDTFTIEGSVPPFQSKNFIELYLGLVDLYSERLSIQLISVEPA